MMQARPAQITDILILGGGAIGLATALEFSARGFSVRLLERQQPGQESSWAGAGILSLLLPWDYGEAVCRLAEYSLALYPDWIDSLRTLARTDPEYRRTGMAVLASWPEARAAAWMRAGGQAQAGLPEAVQQALPADSHGLWLPYVAQVRNPRILRALIEAAHAKGVVIESDTEATAIRVAGARITRIETARGPRCAEHYVLCAGAWSRRLLGDRAQGLAVRPIRGQMLLYRATPDRLPAIIYRDGFYLVPRADGHLLAGSTLEDAGFDKTPTPAAHQTLHAEVARLLPDVAAQGPIRHWAGLRPGSPENIPCIGRHPQIENLYANTGHYRYGLTLAPGSVRLLADLFSGRASALPAAPYAWPSRYTNPADYLL